MARLLKLTLILVIGTGFIGNFQVSRPEVKEPLQPEEVISGFSIIEGNSILAGSPLPEPQVAKKIKVVVTAYSSTYFETDGNPFITAAGTQVRDGIIANNKYPFGTKIRFPEIYGEKIFVVEDRMNWKKGPYHFDIWFSSYWEALNFGAKNTYVEILEG